MGGHQQSGVIRSWQLATSDGQGSEVHVGRGIANIVAVRPAAASRIAIFTQPSVAAIADRVADLARTESAAIVHVRELPDGDAAKRSNVVEAAYEWLNSVSFTRDDFVVGVGGGALTDAVGFVAATYLRGVPVSYLPTTLLGAVDASIGGKTGINVGGKNLAGVFRHPRKVVVDLDILDDLPPHLLIEGAAETVKAGFIADHAIVEAYENRGLNAALAEVVPAAIAVKVNTVQADFREAGLRAILNYGHTVGHAVEIAAGIPHGHAVSIGMVAAGKIAEEDLGFGGADRQRRVLEKIGLPTISPAVDRSLIDTLMGRDKKRDAQGIRMVLLEDFGAPVVKHVTPHDLRSGLAEVGIG